MNQELKTIKKKYGERMMHLCRELFPTILEKEGRLLEILDANFGLPKYLYDDIIKKNATSSFKNFIYFEYHDSSELKISSESPFELMNDAGYTLYECHNNDEIMEFKKYYADSEELCTFKENRLDYCHVFFAVKKNVDEIKREDFKSPKREDEYGTSVISIQFSRGSVNTLSIKNRYNHTVPHPDATFHNNLENIMPGLTDSFKKTYHFNINQQEQDYLELEYVKADDGKYYKYNMEINGIYYCPDNIIIDHGKVIKDFIDKEKYILMDYFVLNLQKNDINQLHGKCINVYDKKIEDSFIDDLQGFDKINVIKNKESTRIIELIKNNQENVYIKLNELNSIIGYKNNNIKNIGDYFLSENDELKELTLDNLITIEDCFLSSNSKLINLCLPSVSDIGDYFLFHNKLLKTLSLPKVERIDNKFLYKNRNLEYLYIPKVRIIGSGFLFNNLKLTNLSLFQLESVGSNFLYENQILSSFYAPQLASAGKCFLVNNKELKVIDFPNLVVLHSNFLNKNETLEKINLPGVETISDNCLVCTNIDEIDLPNVEDIGYGFMYENKCLKEINLPKVECIGNSFLFRNSELRQLSLPKVEEIGNNFLYENKVLNYLYTPNLSVVSESFLYNNRELRHLYLPFLSHIEYQFLHCNQKLNYLYMPNLNHYKFDYFDKIDYLKGINPKIKYKVKNY